MVDSICLKITNLMQYQWIGEVLNLETKRQGITVLNCECLEGDYQNKIAAIKEIRYNDTGKRKVFYSNKIFLPSSHYYLAYKIDDIANCVDFNFSIPKYLYGTNIIQFVPHVTDRKNYHARSDVENFEYVKRITFDRLMAFLDFFINQLKYQQVENGKVVKYTISKRDVEIVRLDLCFNQYFKSFDDAITYLTYQKRIKKSYIRDNSNNHTDWGSSIFLQADTYVAKIYHKGKEYSSSSGERKHHEAINKKAGKCIFPVDKLQEEADKILRYEISFKNGYISRIYKKKVFRCNDSFHSSLRVAYKTKMSIDSKIEILNTKEAELLSITKDLTARNLIISKYLKERKEISLELFNPITLLKQYQLKIKGLQNQTLTVKQGAMIYNQILNQTNNFMLDVTPEAEKYNSKTIEFQYDNKGCVKLNKEARFSPQVFDEMVAVFRSFIDEFQLSERLQLDQLGLNIKSYNKYADSIKDHFKIQKIQEKPLAKVAALMEHYTIDEMVGLGIISRRSKYDIIKRLKLVEMNKASILPEPIMCDISFKEYHFHRNNMESFNALILN
jgi:hypothetical protein